jgi:xanthine dehydrogenase accessory factor
MAKSAVRTREPTRARPVAVVLGCDVLGSAVAHALHGAGYAVVLADETDPAWPRRGMAFTNAWYIGTAELEGETACFCASVRSIPSVLGQRLIAATTWSWPGLAEALRPEVIVDARLHADPGQRSPQGPMESIIRLVGGSHRGADVHAAVGEIELSAPRLGEDARGNPDYAGAPYWVTRTEQAGRCMTTRRIGDRVRAGEVVAQVGLSAIVAPASGALCGLAARGARLRAGQTVVEVDPRGDPVLCFGLWDAARPVAADVLVALRGAALAN